MNNSDLKKEKEELKKQKELQKREKIINGKLWGVIFSIALPLVLYNLCNYFYGIYDIMIVGQSSIGDVDSVAFLDQVKNMISTLGAALAVGGSIIVARKYGEGNVDLARKNANTLFLVSMVVAIGVIAIFIPFGVPFLKVFKTPQSFIDSSMGYFNIQMLSVAVVVINNVFIGIEKAKGNTNRLLILNVIVVVVKIGLTTLFVYCIPGANVSYVAAATLIAQLCMMVCGLIILFNPANILGISLKYLKPTKAQVVAIIMISFPIFIGKFLFSFGKVFVNTQVTAVYATTAVGALAISNSISGFITNILNSFEDAASTITSQNLGNKNIRRTMETFNKVLIIAVSIGVVGTVLLSSFSVPISKFFAPGDPVKQEMIRNINFYENLALGFLGLETAAFGLLYGYGKTRLTMGVSILRLFLFRIPPLLFMMYCLDGKIGYESTGIAMGLSNALSGLLAFTLAILVIRSVKKNGQFQGIELTKVGE